MRKWLFLSLIAALILTACATPGIPNPEDLDWCYTYDFRLSGVIEDVNIITGEWIDGEGIATAPTGDLVANLTSPSGIYVQPLVAVIRFGRGVGVSGDIAVQAVGAIFGISVAIDETIPGIAPDDQLEKSFVPDTDENGAITEGNAINATLNASQQLIIREIEVAGNGRSPFPINPCGEEAEPTATDTDAPLTSTPTASVTPTATSTITPTPTPTPDSFCNLSGQPNVTWSVCYDFTLSDYGFTPVTAFGDQRGVYSPGVGWIGQPSDMNSSASVRTNIVDLVSPPWPAISGGHLRHVRARYTWVGGTNQGSSTNYGQMVTSGTFWSRATMDAAAAAGGGVGIVNLNGSYTFSPAGTWNARFLSAQCAPCGGLTPGTMILTGLVIGGDSTPPQTQTPTATLTRTNTPTGTRTPTATLTATRTRTPIFTAGSPTGTRTPTRTPIMVFTPSPQPPTLTPPPTLPPPTPVPPTIAATPTVITATPQTYTPDPVTSTPFGTSAGTPWGTPVQWGTPFAPDLTDIPTSEPLETPQPADYGPVYDFLSTAAAEVSNLPDDVDGLVPSVNPLPLFGYAKWTFSCASVQELMGATLSPIGCHALLGISLHVVLAGILLTIRVVRMVIKVAMWIVTQIIRVIPFIG